MEGLNILRHRVILTLYFRQFIIGKIDVNKQVFLMKRAYLIHNDPRLEGKLKIQ